MRYEWRAALSGELHHGRLTIDVEGVAIEVDSRVWRHQLDGLRLLHRASALQAAQHEGELGIISTNPAVSPVAAGPTWSYTAWLNLIFLLLAAILLVRLLRTR